MKKGFRLSYNAPVTLTFSLCCIFIVVLDQYLTRGKIVRMFFAVPGNKNSNFPFDWTNALCYIKLFIHVFGHADINHLLGNLSFILLLGPLMEERYGSLRLAFMMILTAFITGLINALFLTTFLAGSSGIGFMLIVLASLSTLKQHTIPFSFIMIIGVYIARELISPSEQNVSTIAHIIGGLCGSVFAFIHSSKATKKIESKENLSEQERENRLKEIDENSPRNKTQSKKKNKSYSENDATVIGTIKL
ncbi:rhomboid family intramembrane serine protease [Treponema pectinovorum]|uniref:rhomboid family intramembrane serine protease n=1 Tax=Treponema pectinovorum TaxID=164 RepID=UPI0011F2C5CC|nr:rhomboid family intramembrane serine protease [Treponema pectinovorum]